MGNSIHHLPPKYKNLHKTLGVKQKYVKKWYLEFIKRGTIGLSEFSAMYTKRNKMSDLCTQYLVRMLDKNGDNKLDFEEFANGFVMIKQSSKEEKLYWVFDMIDKDKSGYLCRNELKELLMSEHYDKCRKGLAFNNTNLLMICEMEAERMINMMDLNRDGRITFEEFKETASRDPVIIHLLERF